MSPHGSQLDENFVQPVYGQSRFERFCYGVYDFFDKPITWFRESVVVPNRKDYAWYHQDYKRVRSIDQCYTDEWDCIYEANEQFRRDKRVDSSIVSILRYRVDDCVREEYPDHLPRCLQLQEEYEQAAANWMSRYGDLSADYNVETAFMKQKHRMIWERRHGPIGCGKKEDVYSVQPERDVYDHRPRGEFPKEE